MNGNTITFRPRQSRGMYWAGGIGVGTFLLCAGPFIVLAGEIPLALVAVVLVISLAATGPIVAIAAWAPSMRYELTDDALHLRFGPFMNDRIPVERIRRVERRDLRPSMLASFRFPGLALFDVDYIDANRVRMCATSSSRGILLIETDRRRYGITPADEKGFVRSLRERSNGTIDVSGLAETDARL